MTATRLGRLHFLKVTMIIEASTRESTPQDSPRVGSPTPFTSTRVAYPGRGFLSGLRNDLPETPGAIAWPVKQWNPPSRGWLS